MGVPYDVFTSAFLSKIVEFDFPARDYERNEVVDGYMKRSIAAFKHVCKYDLVTTRDDVVREFDIEIADEDLEELVEIVSDGMVVQWLKPYMYRQENLENILNTADITTYSPANILLRVRETYQDTSSRFTNAIREYSYNHGDLTDLHL